MRYGFTAPWLPLLVGAVLAAFTVLCFRGILHNPFLAEDLWQSQIWNWDIGYWLNVAFFPGAGGYRPLMFVFWAITGSLWKDHVFAYRMLVLWLHLLNACVLYSLAGQVTRSRPLGLLSGLLFISFVPSTEAVNWLSAASNQVIGLLGYLLALRSFVALSRTPAQQDPQKRRLYVLCGSALLLALGANEMALTWPVVAVIVAAMAKLMAPRAAAAVTVTTNRSRRITITWLKDMLIRTLPLLAV